MSNLRIRSKIWLEVDGKPFLGDGRHRLLWAVQRNGSINAAARELEMSYRKVWSQLLIDGGDIAVPLNGVSHWR